MNDTEDRVRREALLASVTTEAQGFYNLVMTAATSFLGGTLLFMEKVAAPSNWSVFAIGAGWLSLVGAIACVAIVRRINLLSGGHALASQHDESKKLDKKGNFLTTSGTVLLIVGMLFITLGAIVNLSALKEKKEEEGMAKVESGKTGSTSRNGSINYGVTGTPGVVEKSISYGNAGSQGSNVTPPASTPQQTPSTPSSGSQSTPGAANSGGGSGGKGDGK